MWLDRSHRGTSFKEPAVVYQERRACGSSTDLFDVSRKVCQRRSDNANRTMLRLESAAIIPIGAAFVAAIVVTRCLAV